MKKRIIPIVLLMVVTTLSFVMAGDFKINYGGSPIFTVATNGTVIAQNIAISQGLSAVGNISTSAFFVGDGRFLTNVVVPDDSITLDYHNITSIPNCAGQYLTFDGTDLSCVGITISDNSVNIAGENITSGTIDEARLPSTIYTIGINASALAVGTIPTARLPDLTDGITLDYHNVTNIPTCGAGEHLTFDGSDLSCTSDVGADYTNLAWTNETNTFTEYQTFNSGIKLASNDTVITRTGKESTNISIDSSGNIIINLG